MVPSLEDQSLSLLKYLLGWAWAGPLEREVQTQEFFISNEISEIEGEIMKLTDVIKIWDIIHTLDLGTLGYCDLEAAIEKVVGVENDVPGCQPFSCYGIQSPESSKHC